LWLFVHDHEIGARAGAYANVCDRHRDYVTDHTHQLAVAAAGVPFERGVTYATAAEKAPWIHLRAVMSLETAAIEMEATAALSARCRDPVYHLIIAYAKHERPMREQVVGDAERLLAAIGMADHQYVLAAHRDTDDFHAHVIAKGTLTTGIRQEDEFPTHELHLMLPGKALAVSDG
jgi:molybdopterin-guanine dinucleotide biosynthesis protein A